MSSKSLISLRDLSNHRNSLSPENNIRSSPSINLRDQMPLLNSSLSPNYSNIPTGSRQLNKLKKFLSTLQQFGTDMSSEIGDTVRGFILALVHSQMSIEDFHQRLQKATNFPLRPFVIPFLKANLPLLQRELIHYARLAHQTPTEYLSDNENFLYFSDPPSVQNLSRKRRSPAVNRRQHTSSGEESSRDEERHRRHSNPLNNDHHGNHLNNHHLGAVEDDEDEVSYPKRRASLHPLNSLDLRTSSVKNDSFQTFGEQCNQVDNMLSAIVSMASKCKQTVSELKKVSALKHGLMDVNRKSAEEAIREVKRQAITELRIAVLSAESRANDLVTHERSLAAAAIGEAKREARRDCLKQDDNKTSCWNCGRTATETCSGCQTAKYCGRFCQHRHWDQHLSKCTHNNDNNDSSPEIEEPSVKIKSEIDK